MRWCCFQFWFVYRLTLAFLAHFNWLVSIYVNCAYFVLWKSYDLLWFWMHLILCSCFKPLRADNYLLVWCNLIRKRRSAYATSTYKEIYMVEYGKFRRSKTERELDDINAAEASDKEENDLDASEEEQADATESNLQSQCESAAIRQSKLYGTKALAKAVMAEEEKECIEQIFLSQAACSLTNIPQQSAFQEDDAPVPPPRRSKAKTEQGDANCCQSEDRISLLERWRRLSIRQAISSQFSRFRKCFDGGCILQRSHAADTVACAKTDGQSESSHSEGITSRVRRYLPLIRGRQDSSSPPGAVEILAPDFSNKRDLENEKEIERREKRDRKALKKKLRARRRAELAIIAKEEARQKKISNAIGLLLQLLRMMASFAILVGNIRKTFIPAQFKWLKPGRNASDNPELMLLFRCTVFLDVLLFWTNVIWAYCLQWHLCCRLGLLKFWMWVFILVVVGGIFMLLPMSYVQDNLDISWCRFKINSTLAFYQPNW